MILKQVYIDIHLKNWRWDCFSVYR